MLTFGRDSDGEVGFWFNTRGMRGKVQEEELDSCRASAGRGRTREAGAGRNRSGLSLRDFLGGRKAGAANFAAPRVTSIRQLSVSSRLWVDFLQRSSLQDSNLQPFG